MENAGNIITGHLKIYSGLTGALLLMFFFSHYSIILEPMSWYYCFFVLAILMLGYEKIVGFERKPKKVMKSVPIKETPVSIDRKNFILKM